MGLALRLWQAAGTEGGGISLSGAAFPVQSAASLASAASLVSDAASLAASLLPGILLLGISALTKEGVGRGDGWFFLVAGIYMGLGKTLLLLWGSLLLCFPVSLFLLYAGRGRKKRLPFCPLFFLWDWGWCFCESCGSQTVLRELYPGGRMDYGNGLRLDQRDPGTGGEDPR